MSEVEKPLENLLYDLAHSLLANRALLRRLVRKAKHEPGNDECFELAKRQIEDMKKHGVERIIRHEAGGHSWPPREPI